MQVINPKIKELLSYTLTVTKYRKEIQAFRAGIIIGRDF